MRMVRVQGRGYVSAEPDIVTLSFQVEVKAWEYAECLRELNERTEELRAGIESAGVDRKDLKTTSFRVGVDTKYSDGRHTFWGYEASHRLHIELSADKDLLNRVLRNIAQGQSGAEIHISFSVRDKEGLKKRAMEEAVVAAKKNAETLAKASGDRRHEREGAG